MVRPLVGIINHILKKCCMVKLKTEFSAKISLLVQKKLPMKWAIGKIQFTYLNQEIQIFLIVD